MYCTVPARTMLFPRDQQMAPWEELRSMRQSPIQYVFIDEPSSYALSGKRTCGLMPYSSANVHDVIWHIHIRVRRILTPPAK